MPSLTDLFNPSFLMFLGILVLMVSLLVVYFESKMREQNHKIASMLSLVSTLAEDMNGVKMGLNHLAMTRVGGSIPNPFQQPLEHKNIPMSFINEENKLIEVSDDDDSDDDNDDNSEINDEIDLESDNDSDNDSDNNSISDIKVLKLNISKENENEDINESEDIDETENLDLEEDMSMGELEELEDGPLNETDSVSSKSSKLSSKFVEDVLELNKYNETKEESLNISSSDFKTININLEESQEETLDYKKLPLPKLRNIVAEKGLVQDTSKLKKNELLKLLGVE